MKNNNFENTDLIFEVFKNMPHMALVLDENSNIVLGNKNFFELFETSEIEAMNAHFSEYFDSYGFINFLSNFIRSNETKGNIHQPIMLKREKRYYHFTFTKIFLDKNYVVLNGEDQTKIREKQNEIDNLKFKTQYISKLAVLGELASGVSLEIGTPITIIQNHVAQLQRALNNPVVDFDELNKKLVKISHNANRIHKLTKNIELYAIDPKSDPLSSNFVIDLFNSSLELCSEKLKMSDINLIIEDIDPNLKINCRSNQISQTILNIIGHSKVAIENMNEKWIKLSAKDLGQVIQFKITDSGLGKDLKQRERDLKQLQNPKGSIHELGLALKLSKDIIENHIGKFYIDEETNGMSFVFEIPKELNAVATAA